MSLYLLAFLVSIGTLASLLKLGANAVDTEAQIEQANETIETATVENAELTIELGDTPVLAYVPATVTVTEDMPAGYTLKAYSENPTLSTEGTDKTISMVTIPEDGLENAGTLTTALTDNTWGLSTEEPESQTQDIYFSLPATADEAVTIAEVDDTAAEGSDTVTVYYGVYITPDMPKGTYTGANVSYEVEPHYITNLSFDGNGADGGTAIEGTTLSAGETITLPQNTYTREGYSFTGWNTQADGEGKAYANEAEFTASSTQSEDITLYAQWEALPVISDLTEMQDFATLSAEEKASVLASMTEGEQYQLKDNRDQKDYFISKLADGNVWMTQNLDLDIEVPAEGSIVYDSTNTNLPAGAKWEPERATIAKDDLSSGTWPSNSKANNNPYSYDPGDVYYYTSGNNNNDTVTDKATCEQAHQDGSCAHYHAGNYYNWSAAVASNDTSEYGDDDQYTNVETSICPAGWKLANGPQNGTDQFENNEFNALIQDGIAGERPTYCGGLCPFYDYVHSGFKKIRTAPLWLARSGFVGYGSLNNTASDGYYWSSTVNNSNYAYGLYFSSGSVNPASNNDRYVGYSVRCIAQ